MNIIRILLNRVGRFRKWRLRKSAKFGSGTMLYWSGKIGSDDKSGPSMFFGNDTHILGELYVYGGRGRVSVGDSCFIGPNTRIWSWREIVIGNRVLIGHSVTIFDSVTHPLDPVRRAQQFKDIIKRGHPPDLDLDARPVRMGDDVWIGCNAVIMRGVTIGEGAVVGAGSVVTKDVAPWTVVAGNPARFIKNIAHE